MSSSRCLKEFYRVNISGQGPNQAGSDEGNDSEERENRTPRVVIDEPTGNKAEGHSPESRSHAGEAPDGSDAPFSEYIAGYSEQIGESPRVTKC